MAPAGNSSRIASANLCIFSYAPPAFRIFYYSGIFYPLQMNCRFPWSAKYDKISFIDRNFQGALEYHASFLTMDAHV